MKQKNSAKFVSLADRAKRGDFHPIAKLSFRDILELEDVFLGERCLIRENTYREYKRNCKKAGKEPMKLPRIRVYCETPMNMWYCMNTESGDLESTEVEYQTEAVAWLEFGDDF